MIQKLEALGFTTNEAKTYLAALKLGRATAGKIAKEAKLERSSTYDALRRLLLQGIVSYVKESKVKVFCAVDPKRIADSFAEREERALLLAPELTALKSFGSEQETIEKFSGFKGIKAVFQDILHTCSKREEYLIIGMEGQLSEKMPTFAKIFVAKKDRLKIRARGLVRETRKETSRSALTEVRYVPQNSISPASVTVYKDKVAIVMWSEKPEAIIIHNKEAAEAFRSYFEFMWRFAKKKPSEKSKPSTLSGYKST